MPPYLTREAPWFAFLIHPRERRDIHRWSGADLLRRYSRTEEEVERKILANPPFVMAEVLFGASPVRGEIVAVPSLPAEIFRETGRGKVREAALLAAGRGARVLGLGGLTAPVTRGGATLLSELPSAVTVTTGNAYTAVVARDNVLEAAASLDLGRTPRVAVVGCTGSVGSAASRLLAEEEFELILIGRTLSRTEHEVGDLAGQALLSASLVDVRRADVVLLVTSHPSARLVPELFRGRDARDVVVIDVAQPHNVPPADYGLFASEGVVVVEGGLVEIPGYVCTEDIGLEQVGVAYACLGETYLFAREGIRDHSVGHPSLELARRLERAARRRGVTPSSLGLGAPAADLVAAVPAR